MIEEAEVICLVENRTLRPELRCEHGLALWLRLDGAGVLFDTGQTDACCANAAALGVDLASAEAIVLSHGHYDHTGGLPCAVQQAPAARVFAHPAVQGGRYSCTSGMPGREIGLPAASRRALLNIGERFVSTEAPTEIRPGVFVTGAVPRRNAFEDVGGPFFTDRHGVEPDQLPDDQALFFETRRGIVVILGCAHAGVVNTLTYVRELTGGKPIDCVMGGIHLGGASAERIARTVEHFKRLDVKWLFPAHCTGERVEMILRERLPGRSEGLSAGMRVQLAGGTIQVV